MSDFLKIKIETFSTEENEILIAKLSDIQFYAFEDEENLLYAYIKEEDFDEKKLKGILTDNQHFKKTVIKEENWNQQWESELKPVVISDFVAIRAFFHEPVKNVKHDLIITPKMSFGTGHHPTTFLMIEQIQNIDFNNKIVIDFGTGTGVLAILAEKLGAKKIFAIDYDEWSIKNVQENIEANRCENIRVIKSNNLDGIPAADIIFANINLNVLTESAESISSLLKSGSWLLTSGFLMKDEIAIENLFSTKQLEKKLVLNKEGWISVSFQKR